MNLTQKDNKTTMSPGKKSAQAWGKAPQIAVTHLDRNVDSFLMRNREGMSVAIINYGATIAGIEVPDRSGRIEEVTLGHEDPVNHIGGRYYLGAVVGRYANRIAGGRFKLHGEQIQVTTNTKGNHLHGGLVGFDKRFWNAKIKDEGDDSSLELSLVSPDGEEGFPGRMDVTVTYSLNDQNELMIDYRATTDKPTVLNLTNHAYFNLTGSTANSVLNHVLHINADKFTPTDEMSIPTGEFADVAGTPMDFRTPTVIGDRIDANFDQLVSSKGYDKNWVLNGYSRNVRKAATVFDPSSGRKMEVMTDQPGIQFYTGNYLDGTMTGKKGIRYEKRSGLCLECQHFPDSPNQSNFPSVVLEPGEVYRQTTIYKFSIV